MRPASILAWIRRRRVRPNSYFGVYRDFDEACAAAPAGRPLGYDNAAAAGLYQELLEKPRHDDYPAVFWLQRALGGGRTILEIGGHVGIAYYAFERLLAPPAGIVWTILDTPAVVEAGRRLARERSRGNLHFVTGFDEVDGAADILFASGSLQYLPGPLLPERVRAMARPPRHVLINKTPVTDRNGFVTLQDIGVSVCPYRVHSRGELIEPLLALGYALVDSWQKERRLAVAGHPDRTIDHYSGFYLTRED